MRLSRVALLLLAALAGGAVMALLRGASPETGFYLRVILVLVGAICADVLVTLLFVLPLVPLIGWLGRPLMHRNYVFFVGWNLLRSQRSVPILRHRVRAAFANWLGRAPARRSGLIAQLCVALAIASGAALTLAFVRPPNQAHWGPPMLSALGGTLVATLLFAVRATVRLLRPPAAPGGGSAKPFVATYRPRHAVTTATLIAIVSVGVGVSTLIITLSTMSGFREFLQEKILNNSDQLLVRHTEPARPIDDHRRLTDRLAALPQVGAVFPYVEGDVIVSSPASLATSVSLRGVIPADLEASGRLAGAIVLGGIRYLDEPHRLLSDRIPADPLEMAPGAAPVAPGGADRPAPAADDDEDAAAAEDDEEPAAAEDDEEPAAADDAEDAAAAEDDDSLSPDEGAPPQFIHPSILLGEELANSLQVEVGGELQIISPDGEVGPLGVQPKTRTFRVAGTFHTGMYEYDLKQAFIELGQAQAFFNYGDAVNRLELRASGGTGDTDAALVAATAALGGSGLQVLDWKALNRNLFAALAIEKLVMFTILGLVLVVAAFAIVAALVMTILQRARQIATLKALGAPNRGILRTFLVVGGFIGSIGTAAGIALGLGACGLMRIHGVPLPREYYVKVLPVRVDPFEVAAVALAAIAVCLAATLLPALTAARLRPVEGLRYD